MDQSTFLISAFLQLAGMIITIVIVVVRVKSSTDKAIATVVAETADLKSSVTGLEGAVGKLTDVATELRIDMAAHAADKSSIFRRLERLEKQIEDLCRNDKASP